MRHRFHLLGTFRVICVNSTGGIGLFQLLDNNGRFAK